LKDCIDSIAKSPVWEKLKAHGAVLLGKTNMDEFAMGALGNQLLWGAAEPQKHELCYRRFFGRFGCGCLRQSCGIQPGLGYGRFYPSAGLFLWSGGLKPTYGAVSRYGLIAYGSSLDQIGPMTNSVKDAAIVFDAIKGGDSAIRPVWIMIMVPLWLNVWTGMSRECALVWRGIL